MIALLPITYSEVSNHSSLFVFFFLHICNSFELALAFSTQHFLIVQPRVYQRNCEKQMVKFAKLPFPKQKNLLSEVDYI